MVLFMSFQTYSNTIPSAKKTTNTNEWTKVDYNDNNLRIYYELSTNGIYFKIETPKDVNYKIEMYDVYGRKILTKDVEFSTNFHRTNVPRGVYCLKIYKSDSVINKRIIVY